MTERKKRREMFRVTSQSTMEAEKEVVGSEGDTKMAPPLLNVQQRTVAPLFDVHQDTS